MTRRAVLGYKTSSLLSYQRGVHQVIAANRSILSHPCNFYLLDATCTLTQCFLFFHLHFLSLSFLPQAPRQRPTRCRATSLGTTFSMSSPGKPSLILPMAECKRHPSYLRHLFAFFIFLMVSLLSHLEIMWIKRLRYLRTSLSPQTVPSLCAATGTRR